MKLKRKKICVKTLNVGKLRLKHKVFAFFMLIGISFYLYLRYIATPIVVANTESQISSYATRSINYAIADTMNQNVSYGDLITVVKDDSNNVSFIEANSVRINILSKSMSRVVMSNFLEFAKLPIKISLGAFTGIAVLTGSGPKIAYSVNPFGEVHSSFESVFESAGINQTYHKIYLTVSLKINVVLPFRKLIVNSASEVLLCESLIVGKIPDVYLNSNTLTDMLNLIPSSYTSWQTLVLCFIMFLWKKYTIWIMQRPLRFSTRSLT